MILQVKEFNRQALKRYDERVRAWDFSKGGFPCRAMYVFERDGEDRKNGYVVCKDNSYFFFLNKDKAILKEQSI